ncbi:S-phase kinase-associated protein 1 [Pancytospora philotis]|nr:S-phase kinase-associated protein 1 [Pancytospora philotis]
MVKLRTSDGETIDIEDRLACKSNLLRNVMDGASDSGVIPLQVDAHTLRTIHSFMALDNSSLKRNYNYLEIFFANEHFEFFEGRPAEEVLRICNAANYLEYLFLLELCCKIIASELADTSKTELARVMLGSDRLSKADAKQAQQEFSWLNEDL